MIFLTHSYCNQVYKKDKLFLPSKYYEGYLGWDDDDEIKDTVTSLKGRNLLRTTKEGLRFANGVSDTKGVKH